MPTANVTPLSEPVKSTPEAVKEWLRAMGEKGQLPANTVRMRCTALDALTSILGPEEPREAKWLLDNVKDLAQRWATVNNAAPDTAMTYQSRVRTALQGYLDYRANPTGFRPNRRSAAPRKDKANARRPSERSSANARVEHTPTLESAENSSPLPRLLRTYPLGGGREFAFALPDDGASVAEITRVAYHLLTLATDFDPTDTGQRKPFVMMRREPDET